MMLKVVIVIILTVNVQSCGNRNLENTKWVNKDLGCTDYFLFCIENKYEFFSCESPESVYGIYSIKSDTLILEEIKGEYDNEFDKNSRHRVELKRLKLFIKDDTLQFVKNMIKDESGYWVEFKHDLENFIFTRER